MITKTAWKNIWRNKVRSLVVLASVSVGIFAGVFSVAVMEGAIAQRLDDALNHEIGHIQICHRDFRSNNDLASVMGKTGDMEAMIQSIEGVEGVSRRVIVVGMANTAGKSTGVMINGIDPAAEVAVFGLHNKLMEDSGEYLNNDAKANQIYIGEDLAKSLNIIRYIITETVIDSLISSGIPASTADKLRPLAGTRFSNEKSFNKNTGLVLSENEVHNYGKIIKKQARTYRQGARLALSFVDMDNYHTGGMFRVAGLYNISNNMFESSRVFVHREDLKRLTGLAAEEDHMLTVRLKNVDDTDRLTEQMHQLFPGYEVLSWKQIQPDLAMMESMATLMYGVFMLIILAALAFGIVNTMLMVVLERTKELGMLTAIGMNKKKVFRMIITESVFLSLTGGLLGMILSKVVVLLTARRGINFSGYQEGFEAMGYSSHIIPQIGNDFFLIVTLLIIFTGIFSAIYPALKALRLDPADALRTE